MKNVIKDLVKILKQIEEKSPGEAARIRAEFPEYFQEQTEYQIFKLEYNTYKGTGRCWIAQIDPETKKIESFLSAESVEREGTYKGKKIYKVPIFEGRAYQFRESDTKSVDKNYYRIVRDGKLEPL